jgi:hypothetical protein
MTVHDDLRSMGLAFSSDGARVTVSERCQAPLFGRSGWRPFSLTMTTRDLQRIGALLREEGGRGHFPVAGWVTTVDESVEETTRLSALKDPWGDAWYLSVTHWHESVDHSARWMETSDIGRVPSSDVRHFGLVRDMWRGGLRPLDLAPLCLAAGLGVDEAIPLAAGGPDADDVRQGLGVLRALRAGSAE